MENEENTDNILTEDTQSIKTPTKQEGATTPPNKPMKAMNAISTTKGPEAMKTAETSESKEKTIMGEEVNVTTKDARQP